MGCNISHRGSEAMGSIIGDLAIIKSIAIFIREHVADET